MNQYRWEVTGAGPRNRPQRYNSFQIAATLEEARNKAIARLPFRRGLSDEARSLLHNAILNDPPIEINDASILFPDK